MAVEYRMKSAAVLPTLEEAGVRRGMRVLDFGCGPGRYTLPAAGLVGGEGIVYAVDVHPLAIGMVERKVRRDRLSNVLTIRTECVTGLSSGSIDIVLLFDALHDMENKMAVLTEIHRVLDQNGRLQYKDHSLFGDQLVSLMESSGFCTADDTARQITFRKC